MKIVWVHSFNQKENQNAGIFMFQLLEEMRAKGFDIKEVYTGKINVFSFFKVYRYLLKETHNHDLIHAQYGSGCGLLTSLLPGKKILTLRGSDWYITKKVTSWREFLHTRLAVGMTKFSLSRFASIITMSNKMSAEISKISKTFKVFTLMDGIDLDKFSIRTRSEARLALGCENDQNPWVLFSSVAEKNSLKRFHLAHEAFLLAKKQIPNLQLKFMNGVSHHMVPNYVAASDVILLTSTHEGWPNIIKEGLSMNIPFVATDVSDLREIANAENTCTVVEEHKESMMVEQLAQGIIKSINSSEKPHLRKYTESMGMDAITKSLIKIYQNI